MLWILTEKLVTEKERLETLITLVYQTRGDLDKALKYHEDAFEIDRKIGNKEGIAQNLGNLGIIFEIKGDLDKALKYYNEA